MIKQWKARKLAQARVLQVKLDKQMVKANTQLEAAEANMINSPCAMRDNMERCTKSCVHFKGGTVYKLPLYNKPGYHVGVEHPKCKLWGHS